MTTTATTGALLRERGKAYGDYTKTSAVATAIRSTLLAGPSADYLPPEEREALTMICHKLARIVCGTPGQTDSWRDIAGYAELAAGWKP